MGSVDVDWVFALAGQQLVIAADAAISQALRAGEAAGQHLAEGTAAATSDDGDDPMLTTPPKQRKKRCTALARWHCVRTIPLMIDCGTIERVNLMHLSQQAAASGG